MIFPNRNLVLYIVQILAISNAILLGWQVTKLGERRYELSKGVSSVNGHDLTSFVNLLVNQK